MAYVNFLESAEIIFSWVWVGVCGVKLRFWKPMEAILPSLCVYSASNASHLILVSIVVSQAPLRPSRWC